MKSAIIILIAVIAPFSASAGFRADDLSSHLLSDCVMRDVGTAPGPVNPRVGAPEEAAPWLTDRAWDVRPYLKCDDEPVVVKRKRGSKPKTGVRAVTPGPAVPQK